MNIQISKKFSNKTIEEFFEYYHVSKKTVYKLQVGKAIYLNGQEASSKTILKENDYLEIDDFSLDTKNVPPVKGEVDIIYEDDDLLIINKPTKLLVHSDGNTDNTLANYVSYYFLTTGQQSPVLPVHRIDYATSGIVIFAKNFLTSAFLSYQLEKQTVIKKYICLAQGNFSEKVGSINKNISKDRHSNKQIINIKGKEALTKYKVIEQNKNYAKLEIEITSGRKHQIRIHLASINHPIVGDDLYGKSSSRLMLHASYVSFLHPRTLEVVIYRSKEPF